MHRMTQTAYLEWMEHKIMTEGQLIDHSKWPCRKKQWNTKIGSSKSSDNRGYIRNKDYQRAEEEFFIIEEMIKNDHTISSKKLFILYIKMEDSINGNKDAASTAWNPLAKVSEVVWFTLPVFYFYLKIYNYNKNHIYFLVSGHMGLRYPRPLQGYVAAIPKA